MEGAGDPKRTRRDHALKANARPALNVRRKPADGQVAEETFGILILEPPLHAT